MKRMILGLLVALGGFVLLLPEADAKRVGGGRTTGVQRNVTSAPPAAAPARPAQQTQQAAPTQQPAAAPAPQPASGFAKWAPMLGGLALGGLLGAMLGGSGFASMLMSWLAIALVVFAVIAVVRLIAQRRSVAAQPLQYAAQPAAAGYSSLGNETVAAPPPSQAAGFDAGAIAPAAPNVPAGFDEAGFVRAAKLNFMKLQAANDAGNLEALREFTTPELFAELSQDLVGRSGAQQTDVLGLNADLLEVVTEGERHWASVRFSGQIRETAGSAPAGFEEIWNLCKPVDGSSGWLLAGIQQTH